MKAYYDVENRRFRISRTDDREANSFFAKRGDSQKMEILPMIGDNPHTYAGLTEMIFAVKAVADDSTPLLLADDFTRNGSTGFYVSDIAQGTAAIEALLADAEYNFIDVYGELTVTDSTYGTVTSKTVDFRIYNDFYKGTEGTPLTEETPDEWLTARAVRFDEAQTLTTGEQEQARDNIGAAEAGAAPTAHAASHAAAGGDPISVVSSQVTDSTSDAVTNPAKLLKTDSFGAIVLGAVTANSVTSTGTGEFYGVYADSGFYGGTLSAQTAAPFPEGIKDGSFTYTISIPTTTGNRTFATTADISDHVAATDPHGDRAYADGLASHYAAALHAPAHRPNGPDPIVVLDNLAAIAAPTAAADSTAGYEAGSKWVYSGVIYWCMDNTAGAAVWVEERSAWAGYRATRELWLRRMARKDSRYVPPSIEAFKLASPAFLSRARVIAGDVRVLVIGNSYSAEAWPKAQFEERFCRMNNTGGYTANQLILNSVGVTLAGGASFTGGTSQTLVPQQDGYLSIPSGGSAIFNGSGTGFLLGYVQEPGGGTLAIEVSADGGSTWTHYTDTVNADGVLSYLNASNPSAWGYAYYRVRLTASLGTVRIGLGGVTGNLTFHLVNTGGGTEFTKWSAVANELDAGTIESWYFAYDPDIVFVRYSNDQALNSYWSEFVTRITASCPNAQIVITGEHSNGAQISRDGDDGWHTRRNDSLRLACASLPNFSYIDCWNWLPNFTHAYGLGTMTSPDDIHLNAVGGDMVRALQWECLKPWLFPKSSQPQAANDYRARTIFETSGWSQTAVLENDISKTNTTDANTITNRLVQFSGLDPQGWYELEWFLYITSNSTVRAKIGLVTLGIAYTNNRDGDFWNNAGTLERLQPPTGGNPGASFSATAFSAGGSTIIYRGKQTFQLNDSPTYLANRRGLVRVTGAQGSSSATAVVFGRGSSFTLRKVNEPTYGGSYHRNLLPL